MATRLERQPRITPEEGWRKPRTGGKETVFETASLPELEEREVSHVAGCDRPLQSWDCIENYYIMQGQPLNTGTNYTPT